MQTWTRCGKSKKNQPCLNVKPEIRHLHQISLGNPGGQSHSLLGCGVKQFVEPVHKLFFIQNAIVITWERQHATARNIMAGPWAPWACFFATFIELDYGKFYRKALYLMVKTMVSCRFSLKPIQWNIMINIKHYETAITLETSWNMWYKRELTFIMQVRHSQTLDQNPRHYQSFGRLVPKSLDSTNSAALRILWKGTEQRCTRDSRARHRQLRAAERSLQAPPFHFVRHIWSCLSSELAHHKHSTPCWQERSKNLAVSLIYNLQKVQSDSEPVHKRPQSHPTCSCHYLIFLLESNSFKSSIRHRFYTKGRVRKVCNATGLRTGMAAKDDIVGQKVTFLSFAKLLSQVFFLPKFRFQYVHQVQVISLSRQVGSGDPNLRCLDWPWRPTEIEVLQHFRGPLRSPGQFARWIPPGPGHAESLSIYL